ncbi:hypothetical protein NU09_1584 [Flavobacterium beibuense]|uniref:Uncharacterized protein n=1 Tax=Flavobacterium beibuense TaxID=657326 RepID=A0A444WBR3_9FLAO|nr:hypothetical protein NU09_1584 [Flavobacterium beibuense]
MQCLSFSKAGHCFAQRYFYLPKNKNIKIKKALQMKRFFYL